MTDLKAQIEALTRKNGDKVKTSMSLDRVPYEAFKAHTTAIGVSQSRVFDLLIQWYLEQLDIDY